MVRIQSHFDSPAQWDNKPVSLSGLNSNIVPEVDRISERRQRPHMRGVIPMKIAGRYRC